MFLPFLMSVLPRGDGGDVLVQRSQGGVTLGTIGI